MNQKIKECSLFFKKSLSYSVFKPHFPVFSSVFSKLFSALALIFLFIGCTTDTSHKTSVTGMCRSCKPYFVRGSWHYPQTHYEYNEIGLASWYGPRFHGKQKASSERFDQHAMNAAHKTLPLPTIVKVTNLENNKSIVVLVDDRGPYVYDGRIIDLSMGAAKAIGSYKNGIAKVRVESLVEDSKALSDYLKKHYIGKEHLKRTWLQIYEQEIKGKYLGKNCPIVDEVNLNPKRKKENTKSPTTDTHQKFVKATKTDNFKTLTKITKKEGIVSPGPKIIQKPYVINAKNTFADKKSADTFAKRIQAKFPTRVVSEKGVNGKTTWRVQAGPFTDESKTNAIRREIKKLTN
ncbi:MAG: septal ring lytic transglycosylase RlpA family protein [Candidatus Paracaedibacteraceae bacterium]|nr:septal ring lytic transglycosylase RlpA family protein [Candidatus Paracaedibacteraceae bacterium]